MISMFLDVILCTLICVAILTLVWCLAGWCLLPLSDRQATILVPDRRDGALERQLRAIEWLRVPGLLRGPVYVACDDLDEEARTEAEAFSSSRSYLYVLTRAQLCAILMMESTHDTTGRTNDSRHSAERAVSESGERV